MKKVNCSIIAVAGVGTLLAAFSIGCGGASNNDQGVSFTNLGFFQEFHQIVQISLMDSLVFPCQLARQQLSQQ